MPHLDHNLRRVYAQGQDLPPKLSVWLSDLSTLPWDLDHCRRLLPPEPQPPRTPLRPIAHLRRLQTRALMHQLLAAQLGVPPQELAPSLGPDGKPELPGLAFNAAHSGHWALLAVAPSGRLGVDLEEVKERGNLDQLAAACMTKREQLLWAQLSKDLQLQVFYRIWTAKEAALKAWGLGISALLQVELDDLAAPQRAEHSAREACNIAQLHLPLGLTGAVATA